MAEGTKRIDKALSNMSVAYGNEEYIWPKFMPEIQVTQDSGNYFVYAQQFRIPETYKAPGVAANMATYAISTSSYNVQRHALKEFIADEDRDNVDKPIMLDKDATEFVTDKLLLKQEYDCKTLLFTTTTFSGNATLNTATSWKYNTTTSAPIQSVLSATAWINKNSGMRANTMIIGLDQFNVTRENPNVYGRIQYVERAVVTEDILASLFDLQNVYVGRAIYDTAKEGETQSLTSIWADDALIAYFNPQMGRKQVTAATIFRVNKYGMPYRVKRWRDEELEGDFIEAGTKYGMRAVATSCAYLYKTVGLS